MKLLESCMSFLSYIHFTANSGLSFPTLYICTCTRACTILHSVEKRPVNSFFHQDTSIKMLGLYWSFFPHVHFMFWNSVLNFPLINFYMTYECHLLFSQKSYSLLQRNIFYSLYLVMLSFKITYSEISLK